MHGGEGQNRKKGKEKSREGEKEGSDFQGGKSGRCAAAFLRFTGIRGHIPSGALAFLTHSSLFKHSQLPPQTLIHPLSNG